MTRNIPEKSVMCNKARRASVIGACYALFPIVKNVLLSSINISKAPKDFAETNPSVPLHALLDFSEPLIGTKPYNVTQTTCFTFSLHLSSHPYLPAPEHDVSAKTFPLFPSTLPLFPPRYLVRYLHQHHCAHRLAHALRALVSARRPPSLLSAIQKFDSLLRRSIPSPSHNSWNAHAPSSISSSISRPLIGRAWETVLGEWGEWGGR